MQIAHILSGGGEVSDPPIYFVGTWCLQMGILGGFQHG